MESFMKKLFLTFVAVMAICCSAQAQDTDNKSSKKPNSAEFIQDRTNRMVSKYNLDDKQAKELLALNQKYSDKLRPAFGGRGGRPGQGRGPQKDSLSRKVDGMTGATASNRPSKEEMDKKMAEMKANREAYEKELKSIMGDKKYAQYQKDLEQARQSRQDKRAKES